MPKSQRGNNNSFWDTCATGFEAGFHETPDRIGDYPAEVFGSERRGDPGLSRVSKEGADAEIAVTAAS